MPPGDLASTFKLLLIGDSGTGKSSLLLRFIDDTWLQPEQTQATIGVDFKDTAGQERFRTLTSSYYRGAQGVILVYDVSNRTSFEHLQIWFNELDTYATSQIVKIIVGNKTDKESSRQVSKQEGMDFAKQMGTLFIETSAKTTKGVQDAFEEVVKRIVETPRLWQVQPQGLDLSQKQDASYCSC